MMQSTGSIWVRALRLVHRNDRSFEPSIESARICGFCQFHHTIKWIRFAICWSLSKLSHSCILLDGMAVFYKWPQNSFRIYPYFQLLLQFRGCFATFKTASFSQFYLCWTHVRLVEVLIQAYFFSVFPATTETGISETLSLEKKILKKVGKKSLSLGQNSEFMEKVICLSTENSNLQ